MRWAFALVANTTAACGRVAFDVTADAVVATALQCEPCTVDANCLVGACSGSLCRLDVEIVVDGLVDCRLAGDPSSGWPVKATSLRAGVYMITAIPSAGSYGPGLPQPWRFNPFCSGLDLSALATASYSTPQEVEMALSPTPIAQPFVGGDLRCAMLDSACGDNSGDDRFMLADSCP